MGRHADESVCILYNGNRSLCVLSYSKTGDAERRRLLLRPCSTAERRISALFSEVLKSRSRDSA